MATTIEQAGVEALAVLLRAHVTDLETFDDWPDPAERLPEKAATILLTGTPREQGCQPVADGFRVIHEAVSPKVPGALTPASDLAVTLAVLNACRNAYEAHRVSAGAGAAHAAADIVNAITLGSAVDLSSGIELSGELALVLNAHFASGAHASPDLESTVAVPEPIDLPTLRARVIAIHRALNSHYAARLYLWRVAEVEQPVQIDLWANYAAVLDDMIARLEPVLHRDATSAPWGDPVIESVAVELTGEWAGETVEIAVEPARRDSYNGDAQQRAEHRATYTGTMRRWRRIWAQSPRIAQVKATLSAGPRTRTAAVTSSGVTLK